MTTAPAWPTRASLVAVWLVAAAGHGALLAVAQAAETGLDDHDPAHQRPGFLDLDELPQPSPRVTDEIPASGRRAIVFFDRPERVQRLCDALDGSDLLDRADIAVVVSGRAPQCEADVAVVSDPDRRLAHEFELHRPRDGGAPVDSDGQIRYQTLDPSAANELFEVSTILGATP